MRNAILLSMLMLAAAAIVASRTDAATGAGRAADLQPVVKVLRGAATEPVADAAPAPLNAEPSTFTIGTLTIAGLGISRLLRRRWIADNAAF